LILERLELEGLGAGVDDSGLRVDRFEGSSCIREFIHIFRSLVIK
jgi:hypothetical protein